MPDSDVAFDPHADLDASGRHAELRREDGQWILVDVGSRNGTWVNGERVGRAPLKDGDEIECGPGGPRLRVELRPPLVGPGPARPDAATMQATPVADAGPVRVDAPTVNATPGHGVGAMPQTTPPPPPTPTPTPSQAPPVAPAGEPKLYGQRTVGLMIDEALEKARSESGGGAARWRIAVAVLVALLFATLGVLAVVFLGGGDVERPDPGHVAASNAAALFRVVATRPEGGDETLCTAFAVRPQLVATTARCVLAIEARRSAGATIDLRGAAGTVTPGRMWRHPAYVEGQPGADVGLVQVAGQTPSLASLAALDQLRGLEDGAPLLAFGYAGEVARTVETDVHEVVALPAGGVRLEHAAPAPEGAPLFDASGAVVGLHALTPGAGGGGGPGYGVGGELLLGLLAGLN